MPLYVALIKYLPCTIVSQRITFLHSQVTTQVRHMNVANKIGHGENRLRLLVMDMHFAIGQWSDVMVRSINNLVARSWEWFGGLGESDDVAIRRKTTRNQARSVPCYNKKMIKLEYFNLHNSRLAILNWVERVNEQVVVVFHVLSSNLRNAFWAGSKTFGGNELNAKSNCAAWCNGFRESNLVYLNLSVNHIALDID